MTDLSAHQIAFASFGEGGSGAGLHHFAASVSIDVSDKEAAETLKRHGLLTGHRGIVGEDGLPSPPILDGFLSDMEDRVFVTLIDKRAFITDFLVGLLLDPFWPQTDEDGKLRKGLAAVISARLAVPVQGGFAREARRFDIMLSERRPEAFVALLDGMPALASRFAAAVAKDRGSILGHWDLFRPACSLLALIDARNALRTYRDHCEAWGEIHRLIAPICVSGQAVDALGCFHIGHNNSKFVSRPEAPIEGYWHAWRPTTPVRAYSTSESPALRLAHVVAEVTARVASGPPEGASKARSWVDRHGYGWEAEKRRFNGYVSAPHFHSRGREGSKTSSATPAEPCHGVISAARRIDSAVVVARRDRLFLKMSEGSACVTALTALRIENLELVGGGVGERGRGDKGFTCNLEEEDEMDFWELAHRIEGQSGWLFASMEAPYGTKRLADREVVEILAGRAKTVVEPNGR